MNQEKFLPLNGINWSIQKIPLSVSKEGNKQISSYYNIIRTDKGIILGSCTDQRVIKQNSAVFAEVKKVAKRFELKVRNAHLLDSGKHIVFKLYPIDNIFQLKRLQEPGDGKVTKCINIIYHHDSGKYNVQNAYTFQVLDGNDIQSILKVPYNDSLDVMVNDAIIKDAEIELSLFKMVEEISSKKFEHEIVSFLFKLHENKTSRKLKYKNDLLDIINKTKDKSDLGLFMAISKYAFEKFPVKDHNASIHLGKAQELIDRAYYFIINNYN